MKIGYIGLTMLISGVVACGAKDSTTTTPVPAPTATPPADKPADTTKTTTTTTTTTTPKVVKPAADLTTPVTTTLSFTTPKKGTALNLAATTTPPETPPVSCSAFRLKIDGTWETKAEAASFPIDAKGKAAVKLKPGTFALRCKLTAGTAEVDYSVFDITAKKNAEATPVVAKKAGTTAPTPPKANLVTVRKSANAVALTGSAAKAQAAKKTPEEIKKQQDGNGKIVDTKAAAKQAKAIDKADKKKGVEPAKKSDKTTDGVGKALANANDKGDAEKKTKTKAAMEAKAKKTALALGLAEPEPLTDEEIEAALDYLDGELEACESEPKNVLKYTSDDGVDDAKLEAMCVKDLIAASDDPEFAKAVYEAMAEDDPVAAELRALPADEKPEDIDTDALAADTALEDAASILFDSEVLATIAGEATMDNFVLLLAALEVGADHLTDEQLDIFITQMDADEIDDTVAAAAGNEFVKLFNMFESEASAEDIEAAVTAFAATLDQDELEAAKSAIKEELDEEAAAAADADAIAAEDEAAADTPVEEAPAEEEGTDTTTETPAMEEAPAET